MRTDEPIILATPAPPPRNRGAFWAWFISGGLHLAAGLGTVALPWLRVADARLRGNSLVASAQLNASYEQPAPSAPETVAFETPPAESPAVPPEPTPVEPSDTAPELPHARQVEASHPALSPAVASQPRNETFVPLEKRAEKRALWTTATPQPIRRVKPVKERPPHHEITVGPVLRLSRASVAAFASIASIVGVDNADPEIVQNEPPEYPAEAVRHGWHGKVVLRLRISATGRVDEVAIATGSGFTVLDEAAQAAVRSWRFRPARLVGYNVSTTVLLPVIFDLSSQAAQPAR